MLQANTFREKFAAGKPTVGTHFLFNDPDIPELIGDIGLFDYGEFCAEYASFDMPMLYHLARAGQCGNLPLMLKPDQESQGFWTQAALGAGFHAILFTDIRTPADVDECHRCLRVDTPDSGGHMGLKLRRPALSAYKSDDYIGALQDVMFCIMIEKNVTLENIDAVLDRARARGVDMTQWGPADFSLSRGTPPLQHSPEIRPFEEKVIAKSLEFGIAPRIEIGSVEQAKRYIDLGVRHFCIGWDRFIYRTALGQLGEGMRKIVETI